MSSNSGSYLSNNNNSSNNAGGTTRFESGEFESSLHFDDAFDPPPPPPAKRQISLSDYKTTPISKHYALNNQILGAFDLLFEQKNFKVAYAIGMQFVEVALLEIPKHGYFYSSRHEEERVQNAMDALRVTEQLESILRQEMQDQATEAERDRIAKLNHLAKEQAHTSTRTYEEDRMKLEQEFSTTSFDTSFCGDINDIIAACPNTTPATSSSTSQGLHRISESSIDQPSVPLRRDSNDDDDSLQPISSKQLHDGPEIMKRHPRRNEEEGRQPPPSTLTRGASDLQRALWLSGLGSVDQTPPVRVSTPEPSGTTLPADERRKKSQTAIDIMTLQLCYHEDFDMLRNVGRVRISRTDTYQGKDAGSINGCTVIAPLLCIHHFHNWGGLPDHGLPDNAIMEVIDSETPAILPEVRSNLGLTKDALIIPSDVHDFMIERQLLSQEQFVTVCGGNILDDSHITEFVNTLRHGGSEGTKFEGKKLAATLFFHEHVVAILKLSRDGSKVWYDWIDSYPKQETLRKTYEDSDDPEFVPNAARIRCVDDESLKATIRWYACSKFSEENRTFIDMYDWDEMASDFDPRVFQAFIWAEM